MSPVVVSDPLLLANELRPILLRLNRHLRLEAHLLGVTSGQVSLLGTIKMHPGIGVRALAVEEGVSAPAISGHIRRLEAQGLVVRTTGVDRRFVSLTVTPAGERVLRSVRSKRTAWLATRLRRLRPDELDALEDAIPSLLRLLDEG